MNLATNLTATAAWNGDGVALAFDGDELSYRGLDAASARVAALLDRYGVRPGDRVGMMLPNVAEFAVIYYGVLRAGCTVVPANLHLKDRELAFYLTDMRARLLFVWHVAAEMVEARAHDAGTEVLFVAPGEFERMLRGVRPAHSVHECADDDTAVILYTAGTTGRPRGAELTHGNLGSNTAAVVDLHGFGPQSVTLAALPLYHSFGQTCVLNATVTAGGCVSLLPRFDAGKALETIERDGVTAFHGVPTMFAAMLNHPDRASFDVSTLTVCVSGGAPMPTGIARDFEGAFGCRVLEGYGLSETSPVASANPSGSRRRAGSIGKPIDGVAMAVVDESGERLPAGTVGEIVVRGHNVMKAYWNRPDETAEAITDGWFHTGDLGRVDEDGYFFVVDRKKDMILRGGRNVSPREVEEVLYEHPAVREAAVLGIPHSELGEEVAAAIAVKRDHGVNPNDLRSFVVRRLAPYKCPTAVWFFHELPKGRTGKILKRELMTPLRAAS